MTYCETCGHGMCVCKHKIDLRKLLTRAEYDALEWLQKHNGEGHFGGRGNTLMAAGEIAPIMRSTWNNLEKKGFVEFYALRKRIRIKVIDHEHSTRGGVR